MTMKDIRDLFDLLELYYSGHPGLAVKNIRTAWLAVLEPYRREDVRRAVTEYLRSHATFPRPQEIAVLCPHLSPAAAKRNTGADWPMDAEAMEAQKSLILRARAELERLIPLRRAAGIPATEDERKAAGMPFSTWMRVLEAAGLGYPGSVFCEADNETI